MVAIQLFFVRHNKRLDLTESKKFSLSDQSARILEGLEHKILIKAFYEKGRYFEVYDQLSKFSVKSRLIELEMVNMDMNPKLSRDYGIVASGHTVLIVGDRSKRIQAPTEANVISAIIELTTGEKKRILFSYAHGERRTGEKKEGGVSTWSEELVRENYEVQEISLIENQILEAGADLVVLPGPRTDLLAAEGDALAGYLKSGGNVMILVDPGTYRELERFLGQYGITLRDDIIVDEKNRYIKKDKFSPIIPYVKKHGITEGTEGLIFFTLARSVLAEEKMPSGVTTQNFLMSSPTSESAPYDVEKTSIKQDTMETDIYPGPVPVAALAEIETSESSKTPGRLVVVGDSDFASNEDILELGNKDFVLNAINWLLEREAFMGARPERRMYGYTSLTPQHARRLFWLTVVTMPGLGFLFAILFFVRRRIKS
jgi:ABC-type uncharacterized transport system involved in gliding motility auxiliary subunit